MTADQEHIENLRDAANAMVLLGKPSTAGKLRAAAERIRVLGEECEATRAYDAHAEGDLCDFEEEKNQQLYRNVTKARAATDAARGGTR